MVKISIIICTKDRSELLQHCLESISVADDIESVTEVLVVNNNSTDDTSAIIASFNTRLKITELIEVESGLSFCRNSGAKRAKGDWLFYLDDDGMIQKDTITQLIYTIKNYNFDLIAGVFIPWNYYNTPKWFPKEWSTYLLKGDKSIREIEDDYVSGNIMALKKSALKETNWFPTHLGMNGEKIAYGEESYVENEFKRLNKSVGINPFMVLLHVVGKHKLSLKWVLRASYALGRDGATVHQKSLKNLPAIFISLIERIIKNFVRSILGIFSSKKYYWQNFVIDNLGPFLSFVGLISATIKRSLFRPTSKTKIQ